MQDEAVGKTVARVESVPELQGRHVAFLAQERVHDRWFGLIQLTLFDDILLEVADGLPLVPLEDDLCDEMADPAHADE